MTEARRGRLIALEGIDGCGKSTQAHRLSERLGAVLTFEPGATRLGTELRRLLLDRDQPPVSDRSEALLMAADRAQHVAEVVVPALDAGTWVVTDRFSASTLAYQGYGRGLDLSELSQLVRWATGGLQADLTVLVEVPVAVASGRRTGIAGDRLEVEGDAVPAAGGRRLPVPGRREFDPVVGGRRHRLGGRGGHRGVVGCPPHARASARWR